MCLTVGSCIDAVFSCDRPGSLCMVPSKYKTVEHVSYYQKRKAHTADEVDESGRKKLNIR